VVEGLRVPADEIDSVETGQLAPGQPAVAAARAQLLAEHGDRSLARLVDEGEGATRRLRLGNRADGDPEACQVCPRAAPELVGAERREEDA
jgi:hypothetical protein